MLLVVPLPIRGKRFFSSSKRPDRLWGPPVRPIRWVVDRPGREADNRPLSGAEVKYPHVPPWHAQGLDRCHVGLKAESRSLLKIRV
jgi:hypothetical protein